MRRNFRAPSDCLERGIDVSGLVGRGFCAASAGMLARYAAGEERPADLAAALPPDVEPEDCARAVRFARDVAERCRAKAAGRGEMPGGVPG